MKTFLKELSFRAFAIFSRFGLFVLPVHYYINLASVSQLERTKERWARKSSLPGITYDLDAQLVRLRNFCLPFAHEYAGNKTFLQAVKLQFGPGYGYVEAQALHAVIRSAKPKRIIEVGSGVSTACMLAAIKINGGETGQTGTMICIEPYPSAELRKLSEVKLVQEPVQSVGFDLFESLGPGDLLFIDSSHTVKPGSDVNYLILEILPRLARGVIVHFHDIYLPYDYPRDVLRTYFQWMETSLLRAYLINNDKVQILFCLSQLHYDRQKALSDIFPEYVPASDVDGLEIEHSRDSAGHFPASIYFEIL